MCDMPVLYYILPFEQNVSYTAVNLINTALYLPVNIDRLCRGLVRVKMLFTYYCYFIFAYFVLVYKIHTPAMVNGRMNDMLYYIVFTSNSTNTIYYILLYITELNTAYLRLFRSVLYYISYDDNNNKHNNLVYYMIQSVYSQTDTAAAAAAGGSNGGYSLARRRYTLPRRDDSR